MRTLAELGEEYADYGVMVDSIEYAADSERSHTIHIFLGTVKQVINEKYGFAHVAECDKVEHLIFLDETLEEL